MNPTRYLITMLSVAAAIAVSVAALNVAVDPLGVFGAARIAGINSAKPAMVGLEREAKLNAPALSGAKALVLGTSRAAIGIDPDEVDPLFPEAYNLAFAAQTLRETRLLLEAHGARMAGRPVVIGLDFFAANAAFDLHPGRTERFLAQARWRRLVAIALSLDTARASIETLAGQDRTSTGSAGRGFSARGHLRWVDAYSARRGGPAAMFAQSEATYARDFYFPPPARRFAWRHGRRDSCADLQAVFDIARRHGIRLVAFFSPSHARQWELVDDLGLWPEFERFKRMAAAANERAAAGAAPYPLLDFAGHFPELSAPPPAGASETLDTHWDSSHYREAVGKIVLERAGFAQREARGSFGARLETATMNEHLGQLRILRARWRAAYPAERETVRALARANRPAGAAILPPGEDGAMPACASAPAGP